MVTIERTNKKLFVLSARKKDLGRIIDSLTLNGVKIKEVRMQAHGTAVFVYLHRVDYKTLRTNLLKKFTRNELTRIMIDSIDRNED